MDASDNKEDPSATIVQQLAKLEVSGPSQTNSSDPTTPTESPQTLQDDLRDWLNAALSASATNPKVYAKVLVSNAAAGSIIGKGGGNINDFQQKTYAKIQLSKASEYFPGTVERILMLTGRLKQVIAALSLILSKLTREGVAPLSPRSKAASATPAASSTASVHQPPSHEDAEPTQGTGFSDSAQESPDEEQEGEAPQEAPQEEQAAEEQPSLRLLLKLLVPQSLCGIIIGRSGITIRQVATDTETIIKVTAADGPAPPLSHRIVTIAGRQEGVLKAIALLTLKMSEDQKFSLYNTLPTLGPSNTMPGGLAPPAGPPMRVMHSMAMHSYGPMQSMAPYYPMAAQGRPHLYPPPPSGLHPAAAYRQQHAEGYGGGAKGGGGGRGFTSLSIMLTEDQGTFLLGRDGRGAADIAQASGVRVKVERDSRPGGKGQYRKIVLSGTPDGVQFAQWLLSQKLAMVSSGMMGYPNGMAVAMAGGALLHPSYMQQQVAGTTYYQTMPYSPSPPFTQQGMAGGEHAPHMQGYPPQQQHTRGLQLDVRRHMGLRGKAPG